MKNTEQNGDLMDVYDMDCDAVHAELETMVGGLGIKYSATPLPGEDRRDAPLRFFVVFEKDGKRIESEYSTGVGIAQAWGREKLRLKPGAKLSDYKLDRIYTQFRPTRKDVIGCLLHDDASIEGCVDFFDWIDEMGGLEDCNAQHLRKYRKGFASIQENADVLRAFFGAQFERARDLAQQL